LCKMFVHPPLSRILLGVDRYHSTPIVLWAILYSTGTTLLVRPLSLANVCSGTSSPIMILENTIRLTKIQLRCRTSLNPSASKSQDLERKEAKGKHAEVSNSTATLFETYCRRLLRNYTAINRRARSSARSRDTQGRSGYVNEIPDGDEFNSIDESGGATNPVIFVG